MATIYAYLLSHSYVANNSVFCFVHACMVVVCFCVVVVCFCFKLCVIS